MQFEYPVVFTERLFDPPNVTLAETISAREPARQHRVFAVVDDGLAAAQPDLSKNIETYCAHHRTLQLADAPFLVPGGEAGKNDPASLQRLLDRLGEARIDRHSFVLVVGGGAVLDMAGYAAALWHRGVRVVRVPSTVLAQNDAGLGVKTAVNIGGVKNALGTFTAPWAVLNDATLLDTLAERDRVAGMSEAVKVALIRDAAFFEWLEESRHALRRFETKAERWMIRRAAELHLNHIAHGGDPFETGSGRPLDFGHWAAHKLEVLSHYELRHGEAVAIGIALDALYSAEMGLIESSDAARVCKLLRALGLPLWHSACARCDSGGRLRLLEGLDEFREHLGGELTVPLLATIGSSVDVHEMDAAAVLRCVERLERGHTTN